MTMETMDRTLQMSDTLAYYGDILAENLTGQQREFLFHLIAMAFTEGRSSVIAEQMSASDTFFKDDGEDE